MSADPLAAWSASGAAWLTGLSDGPPLGAPDGVAAQVQRAWERLSSAAERWGDPRSLDAVDPLSLLGERAALTGMRRHGTTNCSGSTHLLPAADGWLSVALPRPEDVDVVPAWLGQPTDRFAGCAADSLFERIAAGVAERRVAEMTARGALLGMAVSGLGEADARADPVVVASHRSAAARSRPPLVVDLSSLWAGPLCSQVLAGAGASVVKVESSHRPDGLRRGHTGFFDLLNAGKRCVALDLRDRAGIAALAALIDAADVVIEASRPRALAQLGIDADRVVAASPAKVWLSLTAHGRRGDAAMRAGFGDDAAVAGGLVAWPTSDTPCFLADAVADPLTGITAAAAVAESYASGGTWLLDIALARVAAAAAVDQCRPSRVLDDTLVARPRARQPTSAAAELGADTDAVLAELGLP